MTKLATDISGRINIFSQPAQWDISMSACSLDPSLATTEMQTLPI